MINIFYLLNLAYHSNRLKSFFVLEKPPYNYKIVKLITSSDMIKHIVLIYTSRIQLKRWYIR